MLRLLLITPLRPTRVHGVGRRKAAQYSGSALHRVAAVHRNDGACDEVDAPLARNTAIPAKSSITPLRPAGVRRSTWSFRSGKCCRPARVRSVSIQPGSTAFTWTLSRAHATASDFVNWTSPPFEALYAAVVELLQKEYNGPMLMIFPSPTRLKTGWTPRAHRNPLVRLVSRMRCHSARL